MSFVGNTFLFNTQAVESLLPKTWDFKIQQSISDFNLFPEPSQILLL